MSDDGDKIHISDFHLLYWQMGTLFPPLTGLLGAAGTMGASVSALWELIQSEKPVKKIKNISHFCQPHKAPCENFNMIRKMKCVSGMTSLSCFLCPWHPTPQGHLDLSTSSTEIWASVLPFKSFLLGKTQLRLEDLLTSHEVLC